LKNTHYHTLGLTIFASIAEVKLAYRRLAKQYHPDVNPNGKDFFTQITAAYEILGDTSKKYLYDTRLKQGLYDHRPHKTTQQKRWDFQEQELKRRQYYQENYKKHYQQQKERQAHALKKNNYNEYKYILFATPLAVILVLVILNFFQTKNQNDHPIQERNSDKTTMLNNGDAPYSNYFGESIFIKTKARQIVVINKNKEAVICALFQNKKYLRHCYLNPNYSATIEQLPNDTLVINYLLGNNWCNTCQPKTIKNAIGIFQEIKGIYQTKLPQNTSGIIDNVLLSDGNTKITIDDFFSIKN
jgi:curved DNA-binding protein CbpA